ncbi:CsgE family curli-type amyloid fiber assembly protein [Salegentibacter sp. HM20]
MIEFGKKYYLPLLFLISFNASNAQILNEFIKASIQIEDKGEFLNFQAVAENLNSADRNLQYEFIVLKVDAQGNSSRTSQGDRFFLKAYEKMILSSTQVNRAVNGRIIIMHLIYDDDRNPVGRDRLEFEFTEEGIKDVSEKKVIKVSTDEAKPQDGFVLNGLVIENTMTKAGRDFYRFFYSDYYNKQITTPYDIKIDEDPGRGRMTRISVYVQDQLVMRFFAQPRRDYLKQMAEVALQRSLIQLRRLEQQTTTIKHY